LKIRLICIGKVSEAYLREGVEDFTRRVGRYLPLEVTEIREEKGGGKKADPEYIREREAERILGKIPHDAFVVVLDESGEMVTSQGMAELLDRHMSGGTSEVVFVIGGPYGIGKKVKDLKSFLLSLSPMTFTHQMVRLFLLEQIYRGLTILRNEPYHNR